MTPLLLSISQSAKLMNKRREFIRAQMRKKIPGTDRFEIPFIPESRTRVKISVEAIKDWIRRHEVHTHEELRSALDGRRK